MSSEHPAAGSEAAPLSPELLRETHERGRRAFPRLVLGFEAFARRAASVSPQVLLRPAAAEDLYLAIGCEERVVGAWEVVVERLGPRLRALALRSGAGAAESQEVAHDTIDSLFAPPARGGAATGMGTYDGSVRLFSWLAVVLLRRLSDVRRSQKTRSVDPAALREAPVRPLPGRRGVEAHDPASRALESEAVARLEGAFERAWARLTSSEALSILYKFRDGLKQREIAVLLGIGEPRVSRIVSAAIEKVRSEVRRAFPEGPAAVTPSLPHALGRMLEHRSASSRPSDESRVGGTS
jgi:RNA polymerase sigma factor (sigma-70 family)